MEVVQKEIGSNFELNPERLKKSNASIDLSKLGLTGSDEVLLSTGRSAESMVLDEIEIRNPKINKIALVPAFTCHSVIAPFIQKGYKVKTYSIDKCFKFDAECFKKELIVSCAQVVLVHQYFGFCTGQEIERIIREESQNGIVFIEDRTQCLYSGFPLLSVDYYVGSLRKWDALPDGGFAICRQSYFHQKPEFSDTKLETKKLEASLMKYNYLHKCMGNKQEFLMKFREAEKLLDEQKEYYKISRTSVMIQNNLNIADLRKKRRENYSKLYVALKELNDLRIITTELRENEVPLYCAIAVKKRKELQDHLVKKKIYAPVVWPKSNICPVTCKDVQELYASILCLPVDQRYDIDDMNRIANCIKEFYYQCL